MEISRVLTANRGRSQYASSAPARSSVSRRCLLHMRWGRWGSNPRPPDCHAPKVMIHQRPLSTITKNCDDLIGCFRSAGLLRMTRYAFQGSRFKNEMALISVLKSKKVTHRSRSAAVLESVPYNAEKPRYIQAAELCPE